MTRVNKNTKNFWARLAVNYYRDEKILKVGPIAELAFIRLLALAREGVESSLIDGEVPLILARRELRDLVDYSLSHNEGDLEAILGLLENQGLIRREEDKVIIAKYTEWQTSKTEIVEVRAASAKRQQERRDRQRAERGEPLEESDDEDGEHAVGGESSDSGKIKGKHTGGEGEMGLYDDKVEAFADLRKTGEVKKGGRKKLGAHGIDPTLEADAERVINHLAKVRTEKIGGGFKVSETWWADTQRLLRKNDNWLPFTPDQLCDIIDFALSDSFWHANVQTPGGLVRNAWKIYGRDEFIAWSIRHKRPESNRPRQGLAGSPTKKPLRGELPADQKYDRTAETGKL